MVSGLLVGRDILKQLKEQRTGDYIILPPECVNENGVFLDEMTLPELQMRLGKKVIAFPGTFTELFERIAELESVAV